MYMHAYTINTWLKSMNIQSWESHARFYIRKNLLTANYKMANILHHFMLLLGILIFTEATPHKLNTTTRAGKPHLVFMLVDDWGWANVGYHCDTPTKEVVTPNIDKLVKDGLELDQHYVFRVYSPSHSCLMSGRLPIHVNDQNISPDHYNPDDPVSGYSAIPCNMTGLATKLKEGGYATHQVGKWDAGMATPDHTPMGRGFDSSFGYFHHDNDYYTETVEACNGTKIVDIWVTDKPGHGLNGTGPDNYEEGLFKQQLLNVVKNHDPSTPLFLYYVPHIVHTPLQVPDE